MNHISNRAKIAPDVKIGKFTVIEDDVEIGKGTVIGNNVTIYKGTKIGKNVRIDDNAVIGKQPMRAQNSIFKDTAEKPPCRIGDETIIGTSAVIYAGSVIGSKCLIADLATVREDVTIGDMTIIGRGVAVENYCKIGSKCKIETNAYITALSEIEDQVFVAPCVATSNDNSAGRDPDRVKKMKGVTVKKKARIGVNATILPGKVIGEDAFVGAGAVVTKDVEDGKVVIGNPAREKDDLSVSGKEKS
ncbi:N-acetyltransferase [Thermosediminibacter oceani]|uniref:Transferase hexapeptide repeat containing protein n=1 Tax=Thermosediminibacter oceani (strain ATCC BAA-1034 / DSM 16646 / JW/IW-1228P) TaxID=555079 RepID=D9RYA5_THEOJ|nr:N-acetyltransferase [Thermosediminibacter oceani]ADL08329.1 transferase hexapeptide repeat containing protein [Thermosediminibacter oceani DSM 16646]